MTNLAYRVATVVIVVSLFGGSVWADSADLRLWDEAVETFRRNQDWQPGLVSVSFTQFNRRDEVISDSRSLLRIRVGEDGELVTETLESESEGDMGEGGGFGGEDDGAFAVLQVSPFDPQEQWRVAVEATAEVRYIDGRRCVGFRYSVEGEGRRNAVGTAWLAAASGVPVRIEASLEPLPTYLESFIATQHYRTDDDIWAVGALDFEADVRFLLIRRRIESRMEFSEHFIYAD